MKFYMKNGIYNHLNVPRCQKLHKKFITGTVPGHMELIENVITQNVQSPEIKCKYNHLNV
jgi:hypothetical protein